MKKKSFPITNIGSVSLMMIFIVLCLVTFATLSLSSATGDHHFSQKIATHNTQYYEACNDATSRLSEIDNVLDTTYNTNTSNYLLNVSIALADLGLCEVNAHADTYIATYEIPISNTQVLAVDLTLNPIDKLSDGYYRITRWQEIDHADRSSDNSLSLVK